MYINIYIYQRANIHHTHFCGPELFALGNPLVIQVKEKIKDLHPQNPQYLVIIQGNCDQYT